MIIARGQTTGGATQALILGLSRGNIDRLIAGQPIRISQATHGKGVPLGWEVVILFGETEAAIYDDLRRSGALSGTEVKNLPPGAE